MGRLTDFRRFSQIDVQIYRENRWLFSAQVLKNGEMGSLIPQENSTFQILREDTQHASHQERRKNVFARQLPKSQDDERNGVVEHK